jgi:hypothetical protein
MDFILLYPNLFLYFPEASPFKKLCQTPALGSNLSTAGRSICFIVIFYSILLNIYEQKSSKPPECLFLHPVRMKACTAGNEDEHYILLNFKQQDP